MIDELHISGLGVIENAMLRLAPGLTVITGETGAGKTMVVTALELLLGARADAGLVRAGASEALAEARISPPPASASGWTVDEDELVVSREVPAEGRSRARINGRLAPASALTEVLGEIVEVHGQHEHIRLTRSDVQRQLLDRFAGEPHRRVLESHRAAYLAWREAVEALEALDADQRERARELDRLTYELDEIDGVAPDPEGDARLEADLAILENAEELAIAATRAAMALGEEGAADPLGVADEALRRLPVADPVLDDLHERIVAMSMEARDVAAGLRAHAEEIDADPARLEQLRERQRLLNGLQRKYGVDVAEVVAYADRARQRLAALRREEADAGDLEARVAGLESELEELESDVTRGRALAAERLAAAVADHLADLALPHARFEVEVEPGDRGAEGRDRIRFLLAANPGEPPMPIAHAVSGGERSRVALAIEVALADVEDAEVLVFDEVDAGIGGATALAVGEKLAELAARGHGGRGRQVLCVTHLAQLAAFADVHHIVEKGLRGGRTVTTTRRVEEGDRVAELSRMLGGSSDSVAGIEHARELLADATRRRTG